MDRRGGFGLIANVDKQSRSDNTSGEMMHMVSLLAGRSRTPRIVATINQNIPVYSSREQERDAKQPIFLVL